MRTTRTVWVSSSGGFFSELRRRRVLRTLALYVVGAWGLMQVADVMLPGLGLPEESIRYLLVASVGGFPVALVFAWFFDITASGVQRTLPLGALDKEDPGPLRATDYGLLAALVGVLAAIVYGVFAGVVDVPLPAVAPEEVTRPPRAEGPPMVGVLPFAHMGSSEDGEFFASGIHDDLLTRLARLGGLRVISRTSVLQYAGTSKTIPEIGGELRADAILEGGVRIAGSRIRINAQLIDARSDEHLWAETFDRELSADNIFEVQSDIARAISDALQATLTPEDVAELDVIPTSNMAAYREYHEIMRWRRSVHLAGDKVKEFVDGLQRAIDLDPNFTRPMVEIVGTLSIQIFGGGDRDELPRIEALIDRIGRIAPESADYFRAQSLYVYYVLRDFDRALALVQRAQQRAPSDPELVQVQSWIQRRQGDFDGYTESARIAAELDPNDPQLRGIYGGRLLVMHRYDEAREVLRNSNDPSMRIRHARALLELGEHGDIDRYEQALELMYAESDDYRERGYVAWLLWEARLIQGDFLGAGAIVAQMSDEMPQENFMEVSDTLELQAMHALVSGDTIAAAEFAARFRKAREDAGAELKQFQFPPAYFKLQDSIIALAEGRPGEVEDKLSGLWNDAELDRAIWLGRRHHFCQLLAMAGSEEAVACLRNTLSEPSRVQAFYEPLLPFYDKLRSMPAFQQLIDEQAAEGDIPETLLQRIREPVAGV